MFKNVLLLSLLLSLMLLGFGCTKKVELNEKILYLAQGAEVSGFDPIYASDGYAGNEVARVYEGLLEYHYLKRPYELIPNLAATMPEVSKDGLKFIFKLKPGVMFHDDACFTGGIGREMVAEDVAYSFKRNADPKLQSLGWWVIDGKIKGLNEWREKYSGKEVVDYNEGITGLKVIDKYTIEFTLTQPFPQFLYSFTMPFFYIVPQEAVAHYGKEFLNHPVGTGPFKLKEFSRTKTIEYTKNEKYREVFYPSEGEASDQAAGLLVDAGKKLPLADKVVVNIITENQPRWLNFLKGKLDVLGIPKDNFDQAVTPDKSIDQSLSKKGIRLEIKPGIDVTYIAFNHTVKVFQDVRVRRAMSLAYDIDETNKLFYNNNGQPAQSIVPPSIAGHVEGYFNPWAKYDIVLAKKLMAEAGFPEGKGFPEVSYEALASTQSRQMAEHFAKSMEKIGIKVKVNTNTWPELMKKQKNKDAQLYGISWLADYPDAENFLQLIYGPNMSPGSNGSNFNDAEFNKLFKVASLMQDSPERTKKYEELYKMAGEKVPWIYGVHRKNFFLIHGWLKNFKETAFEHGNAKYFNVDLEKKQELFNQL
jgi:ABC-type transport system substrate-binding protein